MFAYRGDAQLICPIGKVVDLWGVVLKESKVGLHSQWGGTAFSGPGIDFGEAQIRLSSGVLLDAQIRDVRMSGAGAQVILDGVGDPPRISVIH